MPTPTLDAYRAANPADNRPDSEVIPSLVGQLQNEGTLSQFPDLVAANQQLYAGAPAGREPIGSDFLKGAIAGSHAAAAKVYSTAALVGGMSGNDGLKNWGMKGYNSQMQQAAAFAPPVSSMSQVHSPEDAARYGAQFLGGFVPQAVGIGGATAVGAAVGSLGGPEGTIAGGLAGLGEAVGLGGASETAGTLAAGAAMGTQSQDYGELVNQGARNPETVAAGVGLLGGVLQAYVPAVVMSKIFGNTAGEEASKAVQDVLSKAETALPGLGSYLAKDVAKQGGTMAVANTATELATMIGESYANRDNPNYKPLTSDEVKQRLVEAGASGTLMGAGFGALEGIHGYSTDRGNLKTAMAAEDTRQANQAATYAAMHELDGQEPPGAPDMSFTPPPQETVAPSEPETNPVAAPVGTPPSAAFVSPNEPEPAIVAPEQPPVTHQAYDPRKELEQQLQPIDPDLARRAALGNVSPEEVAAAINPPAPTEPSKPQERPGTPIEAAPPPPAEKPRAPVEFLGHQETGGNPSHIELWNLTEPIMGHQVGATLSRDTLERAGYEVPKAPDLPPVEPAPPSTASKDNTPGNAASWLPPAAEPIVNPTLEKPPTKSAPPVEKPPVFSSKPIQDTIPELRVPATHMNPGSGYDEIAKVASENLRENEDTVGTSKKLLAVYDRDSDSMKLLPLFRSTGHKWRVALSLEKPENVISKIADRMGLKVSAVNDLLEQPGDRGDLIRAMFGDESARTQHDPFVDELLTKLSKDGKQRFLPTATLDTMEAIQRRVFEFKDKDLYAQRMEEQQARLLPKSAVGSHAIPDATMDKLKKLDPDHARLAQVLISTIESEREKNSGLVYAAKGKEPDATRGILRVPQDSEASEKLGAATHPTDLIRSFGPSKKWMGLFDDAELEGAIGAAKNPKILDGIKGLEGNSPKEKLTSFFKAMALNAGFKDWTDYLVKATKLMGEKDRGSHLDDTTLGRSDTGDEGGSEAEHEDIDGIRGTGTGSAKKVKGWDENAEIFQPVSKVKLFNSKEGDAQLGGLSLDELARLQHALMNGVMDAKGEEEEPGLESFLGNTVLEAREDSKADKMPGPGEDNNFEDSKDILRDFISHVFETSRGTDSAMMSDAEVYKVYAALDRASRNTLPARDDYRETNTEISDRYRATVSSLLGMGVDVNLIEAALDQQADLLSKEMEQVQFGDGRRILIQTMSDIHEPSMENLRTTLHGAAHILFNKESASVRALLLDAVDRMTNLKLDVFSKTRDARISENSTSLTGSLLAEEVLAEHMSYFGLKQKYARGLAGQFIGALKQIYLRGAILWSQIRGYALDPKIAQDYMESRMTEFVDKTLTSTKDLDVMTGNVVWRADKTATLYKSIGGEYQRSEYEPLSGNTVLKDVIPTGRMEALFNLDNHTQFHDYVIRNTKTDKPTIDYFRDKYGVSEKAAPVTEMLDKIEAYHAGSKDGAGGELRWLIEGIRQNIPNFLKENTVRFASTDDDFRKLEVRSSGPEYQAYEADRDAEDPHSAGLYSPNKNEILINPYQPDKYNALGAANLLLHEVVHIGTVRAISMHEQFRTLKGDMDALHYMYPEMDKGSLSSILSKTTKLEGIYNYLKGLTGEDEFYPGAYGMLNLHEFASEVMTNNIFQRKLGEASLPDKLVGSGRLKSAWDTLVHIITGLWTRPPNDKNAYVSSVRAVEQIMRVADAHHFAATDDVVEPRAPMTQNESDRLVTKDYEYNYAAHNSWIDLVNERIAPLAKQAGVATADYLQRVFGVTDPQDARAALDESLSARKDQLPVNKDQRLNNSKGASNQLPDGSVRDAIVRSTLSHAQESMIRLDEIHDDMTRRIPSFEAALADRTQRFSNWSSKLNDLTSIRDDIVKTLRSQLGALQKSLRDATFWSTEHHGLAGVAADLFGAKGGYGLPADVVDLVRESVSEAALSDKTTGLLAYFEQHGTNVLGRLPSELESDLANAHKNYAIEDGPDPRLAPFVDGSPKAKADLAVAIYTAKTLPETTMLLGIRSEKDAMLKSLLVDQLKMSTHEATKNAMPIQAMVGLSDQRKARVMQVKAVVAKYRKSLALAKEDLDNAALVAKESAKAKTAMQLGITDMQKEHNIQAGAFYPSHGATLLLTPDPTGSTVKGKLSLLPKDQNQLIQHIFDNDKWLKQNAGVGGPEYSAVKSQFQALKAVAGGYFQSNVQKSFYARIFESMGTRLRYTGNATAKMSADMIDRYVNVDRSAEKLTFIGRDVTKALGAAKESWGFEKNYDGFIRTVFNPTCHFLEHFDSRPGEEGTAQAKSALQKFLASKPETGQWMREHPESFEHLWDFYNKNLEANHGVRDLAASDVNKSPVLVKDPDLPIKDPFSGRVTPSYRRALDTGYGTTQRDLMPLFELKRTLDSTKDGQGNSLWKTIPKDAPITPDLEKTLFTPQVIDKFVRPYMDDVSSLHFPSPRLEDGESYGKANPASVQQSWNEAQGSLRKFSQGLYARDVPLKPSKGGADEYHQDVLRFLEGQYKKIASLTEGQESFEKRGFGPNFISSNMMDTRKAEDFPPEFTKYRIYDHISLQQMVNNIAAHGTLGRDLGLFDGQNDRNHGITWMFEQARQEMAADHNTLLSARSNALIADPRLPSEEIENRLRTQFGDKEYKRLTNLPYASKEIDDVEKNLWGALTAANGSSRQFSAGAATLQTMVEFMLNNFRSVLTSSNRLIAPMQVYGAGKLGRAQVARSIAGSARNVMGSFVQAMLGDARRANEYDRAVHNSGVGLDRANFLTPASIIADSGKNNSYESQKYLATVRKLRDIVFNTGFKPQDAEERIAPALRPQAPYAMCSEAMDLGVASSEAQYYNDVFKAALDHYRANPLDANNAAFRFTKENLNASLAIPLSDANVTRLHYQMQTMGSTLELETRDLFNQENRGGDLGDVVVPKHLMPLIVSQGLSDIALESDINKGPAWMYNTKFGRFGMFLMKWATLQTNAVVGMAKTRDGEANWQMGKAMAITMAAGIIPASMCISLLIDEYDEHVLGKKSNMIGFNPDSAQQTAAALMERTSRIGTFGMLGDVANGLRVYGSDGDTRGVSFDQRVVFMNTLMSTLSLVNTAVHQEGHLTYDTFYRPLMNTVGGNSILQYGQIMNKMALDMGGSPIFQSEYEQTTKINALNYLRGAGRIAGLEVRQGSGDGYTPTPMHPYLSAMVLAAYANNGSGFQEAYRSALEEAKREGEDDPESAVKRSFAAYAPLKYVFQSEPTSTQISRIMLSLSDKGREDVSSAIQSYDRYAALIGIRSNMTASRSKPKTSPSAF